eukprot:COSAG04_NODE_249_length_18866_cov_8.876805_15_plen_70_part_00
MAELCCTAASSSIDIVATFVYFQDDKKIDRILDKFPNTHEFGWRGGAGLLQLQGFRRIAAGRRTGVAHT